MSLPVLDAKNIGILDQQLHVGERLLFVDVLPQAWACSLGVKLGHIQSKQNWSLCSAPASLQSSNSARNQECEPSLW